MFFLGCFCFCFFLWKVGYVGPKNQNFTKSGPILKKVIWRFLFFPNFRDGYLKKFLNNGDFSLEQIQPSLHKYGFSCDVFDLAIRHKNFRIFFFGFFFLDLKIFGYVFWSPFWPPFMKFLRPKNLNISFSSGKSYLSIFCIDFRILGIRKKFFF